MSTLTTLEASTALTIFRARRDAIVRMFEDAEESARQDRANGYRAHYCVHGTNQWTDYDNICGGCEDGLTTVADYLPLERHNAIHAARQYLTGLDSLMSAYGTLTRIGAADALDIGAALTALAARAGIPTTVSARWRS